MSSIDLLRSAVYALRRAIYYDEEGQLDAALAQYNVATERLFQCEGVVATGALVDILHARAVAVVQRVELVKERLEGGKNNGNVAVVAPVQNRHSQKIIRNSSGASISHSSPSPPPSLQQQQQQQQQHPYRQPQSAQQQYFPNSQPPRPLYQSPQLKQQPYSPHPGSFPQQRPQYYPHLPQYYQQEPPQQHPHQQQQQQHFPPAPSSDANDNPAASSPYSCFLKNICIPSNYNQSVHDVRVNVMQQQQQQPLNQPHQQQHQQQHVPPGWTLAPGHDNIYISTAPIVSTNASASPPPPSHHQHALTQLSQAPSEALQYNSNHPTSSANQTPLYDARLSEPSSPSVRLPKRFPPSLPSSSSAPPPKQHDSIPHRPPPPVPQCLSSSPVPSLPPQQHPQHQSAQVQTNASLHTPDEQVPAASIDKPGPRPNRLCRLISKGVVTAVSRQLNCKFLRNYLEQQDVNVVLRYAFTQKGGVSVEKGATIKAESDFDFEDYAPFVFKELRAMDGISEEAYMNSMKSLIPMVSAGKSGSSFFLSHDRLFVVKSLTNNELEFLLSVLLQYVHYRIMEKNSLLPSFYGLHTFRRVIAQEAPQGTGGDSNSNNNNDNNIPLNTATNDNRNSSSNEDHDGENMNIIHRLQAWRAGGMSAPALHIIVMANVIPPYRRVTRRYDLKGSTVGRQATEEEKQESDVILKDLDFAEPITVTPDFQRAFFEQLDKDCKFLEFHNIMDYSLLLAEATPELEPTDENRSPCHEKRRSLFRSQADGFRAADGKVYYVGIIDILQPYNIKKKVEHAFKAMSKAGDQISCVDPLTYSKRFRTFIREHTSCVLQNGGKYNPYREHDNGGLVDNWTPVSVPYSNTIPLPFESM